MNSIPLHFVGGEHNVMSATMDEVNPYRVEPGPMLDQLIHTRVLGRPPADCPPQYSSSDPEANQVKKHLETRFKTPIDTGRTTIRGKSWFARYERSKGNPTEVVAETYALALCRLGLVRVMQD